MEPKVAQIPAAIDISGIMRKVYNWMFFGLGTTALTSYIMLSVPGLLESLLQNTFLFYGLLILELILVIVLSGRIQVLSPDTAGIIFFGYAVLNGITLSPIFVIYTGSSIASTFLVTAGMFGAMSIYGYTTQKDLSGWGTFLIMALVGLILASVVNMFIGSTTMDWILSFAGVFIFVGLTAYDTQKIRVMAEELQREGRPLIKFSIIAALNLYLDFINLFLQLLRILGRRR